MRVAFPTNNQKTIAKHVGLSKGFLIVDLDTNEKFYIENPVMKKIQEEHIKLNSDCGEHGLGTGRVVPPLLKEAGVNIFIAKELGEGMLGNLEYEGIKTIITDENDIEILLENLKESLMKNNNYLNTNDYFKNNRYGFGRGFRNGFGFGRGFGRGRCFGRDRGFGYGFGRRWNEDGNFIGGGRGFGRRGF